MQRQTISFLAKRFQEVGIRPNTRKGQNFLVDLNLVQLLASSGDVTRDDVVLEVGTGTGSLTAMLAQKAGAVVTVEVDPQLYQLASEELDEYSNITMLRQDALKNKNRLDQRVLDAVQAALDEQPGRRLKLVANLPYSVATPIISNLLSTPVIPSLMAVTIQKELADRITASPSSKAYGALSVWIQVQCDVELVRVLPPSVFWPRPKVHSAIIKIQPDPQKRASVPNIEFFRSFVRAMFFHRRKLLRSVILAAFKGQVDKPAVDGVLAEMKLRPDCRAEQLDIAQMVLLSQMVKARLEEEENR